MLGLSFTTQRKLDQLGDVPKQRIKLEGEAKAHLVEYPGPTNTFHVDLQNFLQCDSCGPAEVCSMKVVLKVVNPKVVDLYWGFFMPKWR